MLGLFLAALDQTIIATALPTIARDLGDIEKVPWVATSYLLASTVSVPLYGKLGDLLGRKRLLQTAILIFVVGSIGCGISQSMLQLTLARAFQGVGAGGLLTLSQAILGDLVSPRERGKYLAYLAGVWAVASIAGPPIGGLITQEISWRWVFYINVPIGAFALIACALSLKLPTSRLEHQIDYLGAALIGAAVICGMGALVGLGGSSIPPAWIPALGLGALVFGGAFVMQERRTVEPILPLELLRVPVVRTACFLGFFVGVSMFISIVFLPLYLQLVVGASAGRSGFLMTPMLLLLVATSMTVGRAISRTGRYRMFPIVGTALLTGTYLMLALISGTTNEVVVVLTTLPIMIGIGCIMQVAVLAVQNAVGSDQLGIATSTERFFRSIGSAVGVAVAGVILSIHLADLPDRAADPAEAKMLEGFTSGAIEGDIGSSLRALPDHALGLLQEEVSGAVGTIFLVAVPLAAAAHVASRRMKELPLRQISHAAARSEAGDRTEEGSSWTPEI